MEKKLINLIWAFVLLFSATAISQTSEKKMDEFEMKQYYLVFLKKGPNRTQDSATAANLQRAHLNHLDKMYKEGKMCMAGPLTDENEIRGICIYNTTTHREAEELANMDPAVKAGRLVVEVHDWYSAKGMKLP